MLKKKVIVEDSIFPISATVGIFYPSSTFRFTTVTTTFAVITFTMTTFTTTFTMTTFTMTTFTTTYTVTSTVDNERKLSSS